MAFNNQPRIRGTVQTETGELIRFVHQPLTIDHFDTHVQIRENGQVVLTRPAGTKDAEGEAEYDEIEVSAGLIFKVAFLLKTTRKIVNVTQQEAIGAGVTRDVPKEEAKGNGEEK